MADEAPVVLHVGLHKTGTTYLQRSLFPALVRHGGLRAADYFDKVPREKALAALKTPRHGPTLISDEHLLRSFFQKPRTHRLQAFQRLRPDAQVVLTLRRPSRWLPSLYGHYLRNGGSRSFPAFIGAENSTGLVDRRDLSFRASLDLIAAVHGRWPTILFHDEILANPAATAGLFAGLLGLDPPALPVSRRRHNTSHHPDSLRLTRALNRRFGTRRRKRSVLDPIMKYAPKVQAATLDALEPVIPAPWLDPLEPFIDPDDLSAHVAALAEDWRFAVEAARAQRPLLVAIDPDRP